MQNRKEKESLFCESQQDEVHCMLETITNIFQRAMKGSFLFDLVFHVCQIFVHFIMNLNLNNFSSKCSLDS